MLTSTWLVQVHASILEGLQQHFLPLCEADFERQQDDSLAQLNARRGLLESQDPAALTCSCCGGEFIFSYVCLVERKGGARPSAVASKRLVHAVQSLMQHL